MLTLVTAAACAVAVTACSDGAEGDAREELRSQVAQLQTQAGYALESATDAAAVREEFASDYGSEVFDGGVEGGEVHWDAVLFGTGRARLAWNTPDLRLRTCVRITGRPGVQKAEVVNLTCPAELDRRPEFTSYDRQVDVVD